MKTRASIPRTPAHYGCKYCKRQNFNSVGALIRHQSTGLCGRMKRQDDLGIKTNSRPESQVTLPLENDPSSDEEDAFLPCFSPPSPPKKRSFRTEAREEIHQEDRHVAMAIGGLFEEEADAPQESDSDVSEQMEYIDKESEDITPDLAHDEGDSSSDEEDSEEEDEKLPPSPGNGPESPGNDPDGHEDVKPNTYIRDQFREYCAHATENFIPLSQDEIRCIRLLHVLKLKNAPLNSYEAIMRWHLIQAQKIRPHESLANYPHYIGRKTIIKKLIKRYNYENKLPYKKTVRLPVSGTTVRITCHSAQATIQRLLTDPRIKAEDYLFWDGNPLQPPPKNLDYVADLNTGRAYLETHVILASKEGQQLMPIVLYSDGTAVSHFHDMEIIQVNMALGTMTRIARNQPHCWAPLGYVEKVHEHGGRGRDILAQSNHMETFDDRSVDSDETVLDASEVEHLGETNAQDFHMMMGVILEELWDLQPGGFLWDHHCPTTGEDTPDIHYQIFVPFVKADSKEADLYAGKYAQRFSTKQICRKCHIPLADADNHQAKIKLKTVSEIAKLIQKGDLQGLKDISQTYLANCFHNLRFSMANDYGIHGSCPSELLHAFLLGLFKYLRDIFFEMIGKDSEGARQLNALAKVYSRFFARQSDRTMPGTSFTKGIQVGKLMGKDYRGVLVIILAMVNSTKGRAILQKYRNFKKESDLDDWILLVETMLEWESYLNEPRMDLKTVKRLGQKHRYIMYLMRKVAQRNKGMGLKLTKFHMILHIMDDILEFGVPLEYDTSANESFHKAAKKASKMTQRAAETFNFQVSNRLIEFEVIDLAMEEIENGLVPWDFYHRGEEKPHARPENETEGLENATPEHEIWTGETKIVIDLDEDGDVGFLLRTRSKFAKNARWNRDLLHFLYQMQALVSTERMQIYTCHRRNGQTFRGHPHYRGKGPWKDWVWVDWVGYGHVPCHIWCFVVLEDMPLGRNRLEYGGIPLCNGTFAVVESSNFVDNGEEEMDTSLMVPIDKEAVLDGDGKVAKRTFFLADTEAFLDPCCVIPDIGGPPCRYFVVRPRNQWAERFEKWVNLPHRNDEMEELVTPKEESEPPEEKTGVDSGSEDGSDAEFAAARRQKRRKGHQKR